MVEDNTYIGQLNSNTTAHGETKSEGGTSDDALAATTTDVASTTNNGDDLVLDFGGFALAVTQVDNEGANSLATSEHEDVVAHYFNYDAYSALLTNAESPCEGEKNAEKTKSGGVLLEHRKPRSRLASASPEPGWGTDTKYTGVMDPIPFMLPMSYEARMNESTTTTDY